MACLRWSYQVRRFVFIKNPKKSLKKLVLFTLKNDKGITLLESLVSLTVLMMISNMFALCFLSLTSFEESTETIQKNEFFIFFEEIQREIFRADAVEITDSSVHILLPNRTVSYSKYANYIRRRVNGSGHEKVLQHISTMQFQFVNGRIQCDITFLNGEKASKRWFTIHEMELKINE